MISRLHYGSSVFFESNVPFQQTLRYVGTRFNIRDRFSESARLNIDWYAIHSNRS